MDLWQSQQLFIYLRLQMNCTKSHRHIQQLIYYQILEERWVYVLDWAYGLYLKLCANVRSNISIERFVLFLGYYMGYKQLLKVFPILSTKSQPFIPKDVPKKENFITLGSTSMLVTDVGEKIFWWQLVTNFMAPTSC